MEKVRELASIREAYGKTLVALGKENPDIVVLDADLSRSTMTRLFAHEFPQRFFNCGIAEQNMMSISAGLAASGKIVFASSFAIFATGRCFDQLRMSIAQPRLNVKVVASHGGISVGEDGFSHHAIEDLALACSLPGFKVIVPADAIETAQVVRIAASTPGPFYIRLNRPKSPLVYSDGYQFVLGKAVTIKQGSDATIIATGIMVARALEAAESLARQGISCRVLSMPTLKPLDREAIILAAEETGAIVTAEEHLEQGGLGSRVAQAVVQHRAVPMAFVAIKDVYAKSGTPEELLERYGLSTDDIEKAVKSTLRKKG
ncbi:MAG TPA: transketolase family protein [Dehalococcoidia bacterium]|nr:transketolase family protein [Dehalococcoidia bacterium]